MLGLAALGVAWYLGRKRYIDGCRVEVVASDSKTSSIVRQTEHEGVVTLSDILHSECPSLTDPQRAYMVPTPYLCTGLLQTIYATMNIRRRDALSDIAYEREMLIMDDGGTVSLDWYPGIKSPGEEDGPIAFLLSGVGGSSHEYHIRVMVKALADCSVGFRVVVFNHRGTARTPITSARPYDSGFTSDFRHAVSRVRAKNPKSTLVAVGFSMGANILTKYIGEEKSECPLACAVTICCPFDIKVSGEAMNADNILNNHVFQPVVMGALKRALKRAQHLPLDPKWGLDMDRIRSSKRLWELEDAILVKVNGYRDLNDYYVRSSSSNYVDDIKIPFLAINSLDDRITPPRGIPREKFQENPNTALTLVPHGGHLAFLTGVAPRIWFIDPVVEFVTAILK
ncbi:AB-hydrolase YheT [Martensiomyces pterosporus]|nr:AB-hydrolase YheT [Martensiomyces pterosporus]